MKVKECVVIVLHRFKVRRELINIMHKASGNETCVLKYNFLSLD